MQLADDALVLTMLPHGEHGAVVRCLGFSIGLRAAYVRGARGRRMRPVLHPGNRVALRLAARGETALPSATVEPVVSRALIGFSPGPALALQWLTELTAAALSDSVPHPRLAEALDSLLEGLAAGMDGTAMQVGVARYELMLLAEEGFGLDLDACALGGDAGDLAFVSPRTGRAVSRARATGQPWAHRLLPLPRPLRTGEPATAQEARQALRLTGHFIGAHWLKDNDRLTALRRRMCDHAGVQKGGARLAATPPADKAGP